MGNIIFQFFSIFNNEKINLKTKNKIFIYYYIKKQLVVYNKQKIFLGRIYPLNWDMDFYIKKLK